MSEQQLRVMVVSDEGLSTGGIGTATLNHVRALAGLGHEVALVWSGPRVNLPGVLEVIVPSKRFDVGKHGFLVLALPPKLEGTAMQGWRADIVHIMRPTLLGAWAYWQARKWRAGVVLAMHEIVDQLSPTTTAGKVLQGLARWWFRVSYNRADLAVAPAHFVVQHVKTGLKLNKPVSYLSNALDLEEWRALAATSGAASPRGERFVCAVINLSPYKNPLFMVDLWRELVQRGIGVKLKIAGGGVLFDELQARIAQIGMGDHIELLGKLPREQVAGLIASSEALLMTSWFELQPMVIIEAKALGKPALVMQAPLSGAVTLVGDGETGVLFPPDAVAAADKLSPWLEDPNALRSLERACRLDAERYDLEAVGRAAVLLYRNASPHRAVRTEGTPRTNLD